MEITTAQLQRGYLSDKHSRFAAKRNYFITDVEQRPWICHNTELLRLYLCISLSKSEPFPSEQQDSEGLDHLLLNYSCCYQIHFYKIIKNTTNRSDSENHWSLLGMLDSENSWQRKCVLILECNLGSDEKSPFQKSPTGWILLWFLHNYFQLAKKGI